MASQHASRTPTANPLSIRALRQELDWATLSGHSDLLSQIYHTIFASSLNIDPSCWWPFFLQTPQACTLGGLCWFLTSVISLSPLTSALLL